MFEVLIFINTWKGLVYFSMLINIAVPKNSQKTLNAHLFTLFFIFFLYHCFSWKGILVSAAGPLQQHHVRDKLIKKK